MTGARTSRLAVWLFTALAAGNGCASTASLGVTPARGQDTVQLERDRAECEAHAERERDRTGMLGRNLGAKLAGLGAGAVAGSLAVFAANTSVSSAKDAQVIGAAVARPSREDDVQREQERAGVLAGDELGDLADGARHVV